MSKESIPFDNGVLLRAQQQKPKSKTVKQKLVDYMLTNGNDFTYTGMLKALLKVKFGPKREYNWKVDRGYYATNFSIGGYMVRGCGDCGLYKNENGRWSAKYYTKEDRAEYKIKNIVSPLMRAAQWNRENYRASIISGEEYAHNHEEMRDRAIKELVKIKLA